MEDYFPVISKNGSVYKTIDDWPDCKRLGCKNKRCDRMFSELCYPHNIEEAMHLGKLENLVEVEAN